MTLGDPRFLWLWLAIALIGAAMVASATRMTRRWTAAFGAEMLRRVRPASVRWRRALRDLSALAGLALAALALAEPRHGERVYTVEQSGVDLVLVMDLSRSMACGDVDPTRMARAQREVYDLIDALEEDRVGVVGFAGGAFPRLPLTQDHAAVRQVVGELGVDTFRTQGSALGAAIRESLALLSRRTGEADPAILILSDGEVHDPADALAAAEEAKAAGVRLFGLGIGEEAAPVPGPTGQPLRERTTGAPIVSKPDDKLLIDLAKVTGGAFVHSVASAEDVQRLYREEIRGRLDAAGRGTLQKKTHESGFQMPLAFGVALLLFSAWIGEGHRRWGAAALLLGAGLAFPPPAEAASVAEADAAYRAGRYVEAAEQLAELVEQAPTDAELWDRLGAARFRAGDAEGAARAWERQDALLGGDADAAFNAGNAHFSARRYDEALARYEQALARDPNHPGARQNLEVVRQELARQPKPPPPPKEGESSEDPQGKPGQGPQQDPGGEGGKPKEPDPNAPKDGTSGEASESSERGKSQQAEGLEGENGKKGQETASERDGAEASEGVAPGELDPNGAEGATASATGSEGGDGAEMSAIQADKILDGVEEGRPRLIVPGDGSSEKPW